MAKPPECEMIKSVKRNLLCECEKIEYPSFRKSGKSEGCLIAHTLLTLVETEKILHRVLNSIRRAFNVLENGTTIEPVEAVFSTVLFHDIGKVDSNYRLGKPVKHHIISAYLAKTVLEKIYFESIANSISLAIYLHHEAHHWRDLASLPILSILEPSKAVFMRVSREDLLKIFTVFYRNCKLFSKLNTLCKLISNVINIIESLKDNFKVKIPRQFPNELKRQLERKCVKGIHKSCALRPVFILYRLLYLVDNRAASVREGIDKYWPQDIRKKWLAYSLLPQHERVESQDSPGKRIDKVIT